MPIIITPVAGDSSVFTDISAALEGHLAAMPFTLPEVMPPVAWENKPFEPVKDTLFLRPTNLQGETVAVTHDQDETLGVYQIDIFAPAGDGKFAVVDMADKIADHFKQDTSMMYLSQRVRVQNVSRGKIETDDNGWVRLNIDVRYYAFSDRR